MEDDGFDCVHGRWSSESDYSSDTLLFYHITVELLTVIRSPGQCKRPPSFQTTASNDSVQRIRLRNTFPALSRLIRTTHFTRLASWANFWSGGSTTHRSNI